jgi:hypothetical protein
LKIPKYTQCTQQQLLIEVCDWRGHQVRVYEIHRTYPAIEMVWRELPNWDCARSRLISNAARIELAQLTVLRDNFSRATPR